MSNKSTELLIEKGLRLTKIRTEILEFFMKSQHPKSVFDLKKLKKFKETNESTLYRNIKKLEEVSLLRSISLHDDFLSYEIVMESRHHHHHITCTSCKETMCLDICLIEKSLKKMASQKGYTLKGHGLELFGTCGNCK